jgi:hypothetical protein
MAFAIFPQRKKLTSKSIDMKKLMINFVFVFLLIAGNMVAAQNNSDEYLGLPGDNLNLYAVIDIFRESETLEEFERQINDPEAMINNLDLNGDNYVDYILVYDYVDGNIHNIVLRVALNENEQQDVAVFIVEKMRDNSVQIQLIGDEALYGPDYIIEPAYAERPNPGYNGNVGQSQNTNVVYTSYYEVATWPMIVYISRPVYRPWRSVWYYGYYPPYWHAWNPYYYHYYYGYHYHWHSHYYVHYRPARRYRCDHYHTVYHTSVREASPRVNTMVRNGDYEKTYTRPEKRSEGEQLFAQRHPQKYEASVSKRSSSRGNMEAKPTGVNQKRERSDSEVKRSSAPSETQRATRNTETRQYQRPAVKRSNENRGNAVEQRSSRPARSSARSEPKVNTRRENRGSAIQRSPSPSRQTKSTPGKRVTRSAPERNSGVKERAPRKSGPSYSKPARQERSTPSVKNKRPSSSVGSSGRSSSRGSGTSVKKNTTKSKSGSTRESNSNSRRR